jgi:hypothetical protein
MLNATSNKKKCPDIPPVIKEEMFIYIYCDSKVAPKLKYKTLFNASLSIEHSNFILVSTRTPQLFIMLQSTPSISKD